MIQLTVFTPTYNRHHTLPRLYQSLCEQTCKDFIWLVVDDGSTDGTREYIEDLIIKDCGFEIRYEYKKNGGMHTAHNLAYRKISTELCVCIDSDDAMPEDAVQIILDCWKNKGSLAVAGLIGLDRDMNTGEIIGKVFPAGLTETTLSGYYAQGGKGDKKLVYRTDLMKSLPEYPEFEGEKYVGLAYKYSLADQICPLIVVDRVLCDVEYQPDGSTNTMYKSYLANPRGFAFYRLNALKHPVSRKRQIIDCIHYCSSCQIAHEKGYIRRTPCPVLTAVCSPAGWLLKNWIRYQVGCTEGTWKNME